MPIQLICERLRSDLSKNPQAITVPKKGSVYIGSRMAMLEMATL